MSIKSKVLTSAVLLLLFVSVVSASEKITVAFGEKLAPWVLTETNQGIIVDIITAAMTPLGYEIEHLYLPYARRTRTFKEGGVDVVSDVNLNTIKGHNLIGYFSDTAYSYENYAFSLHKKKFNFNQISDLTHYSLLSWQDAAIHLGSAYADMAKNNVQYSETFDQSVQVKMLYSDKVDVVQMDVNIFDYYRAKIANSSNIDTSQKVDRFALFGASPNGFFFKSEKMRNQFNTQLRRLKKTGEYQKIFSRYLTPLKVESTEIEYSNKEILVDEM